MVRNHLKRLAMPNTWTTQQKKGITWVARANSGAHSMEEGMPLVLVLREMLKLGNTAREVRNILHHKELLVDGIRRKDHKFNVGLMDVLAIPETKEYFRISLNKYRKLVPIKIEEKESNSKICTIKGKGLYKGKIQLRLSDGRTILIQKGEYKTSDALVISVPDQKILLHIKFEKGAAVLLTGGKNIGKIGVIENIKNNLVTIKSNNELFEASKDNCFVVGKNKPALTIE